jgi:predicted 3-demethylubiquinone-9 3-methyltransferase (glyoxalase superfamily)
MSQKIVPNLWFDTEAEEAAQFYVDVFGEGRVLNVTRYPASSPGGEEGQVMTVDWEVRGMRFTGINGGPQFSFNEAVSFLIECEDQAEVDYFWEKLTADGGKEGPCGWCGDKYGLSWQVVPRGMDELMGGGDPARGRRAMEAMFQMKKLDVAALWAAADGEPAAS